MPRKKKSQAPEPGLTTDEKPERKPSETPEPAQGSSPAVGPSFSRELPPGTASLSQREQESERPLKPESPASAQDAKAEVEAEVKAHAADTFEEAFEEETRPDGEIHRQTASPERSAEAGEAAAKPAKKPAGKVARKPAKGSEPAQEPESAEEKGQEEEFAPEARPPARLERLQKILSQAGIASRRHAEELITQGRVQVNGKIITELGSKADPDRDHIRVDGKLLKGAERLRYFMLNKPRGYVTTVSDPEGRPTVMEFFSRMGERLYPVGRLDYQSEGLLLVTNDGDLANKLTRAASGVEKTYLVKVSGNPTGEELAQLREGVRIERGRPGEGHVQTAPAEIRKVRQGDNPWYEVVLIEGRNRELRKMFEEVGHHVEKIRRVGYGPLVLDLEPGKIRELEPDELAALRRAAEGKPAQGKARLAAHRGFPDEGATQPKARRERKPEREHSDRREQQGRFRPERSSRPDGWGRREFFRSPGRGPVGPPAAGKRDKAREEFGGSSRPGRGFTRPGSGGRSPGGQGPGVRAADRPSSAPPRTGKDRPAGGAGERAPRPETRFGSGRPQPSDRGSYGPVTPSRGGFSRRGGEEFRPSGPGRRSGSQRGGPASQRGGGQRGGGDFGGGDQGRGGRSGPTGRSGDRWRPQKKSRFDAGGFGGEGARGRPSGQNRSGPSTKGSGRGAGLRPGSRRPENRSGRGGRKRP